MRLKLIALVQAGHTAQARELCKALGVPLDLRRANLRWADLTGADLTGADMTHDGEMFGLGLFWGARTGELLGCPSVLPSNSRCVSLQNGRFALVAPEVDLSDSDLTGVQVYGLLQACLMGLPPEWRCIVHPVTVELEDGEIIPDLDDPDVPSEV